MKLKHILNFSIFFLFICSSSFLGSQELAMQSLVKKRALADLDVIHRIFEVKYAPLQWKGEFANWDLDLAIQEAKDKVSDLASPTLKECQVIIRDFFNSAQDFHVGVHFYSTESSSLPFLVKGAQGRYFVCDIDEEFAPTSFPFEVGDEILSFGGRPLDEVISELRMREFGANTPETTQALAELCLTYRQGAAAQQIPTGEVEITGNKKGSKKESRYTLSWNYESEKIEDFAKLGLDASLSLPKKESRKTKPLQVKEFCNKLMMTHFCAPAQLKKGVQAGPHKIGARTSYLPELGEKMWEIDSDWIFDAYIFETPTGKDVGYIRLPHYSGDEEEMEEFGEIINFLQEHTDALVIDQINNPGGSLFYLYGLASSLTDKRLEPPKHRIVLTQEEVHMAVSMLPSLEEIEDDFSAQCVLGETLAGYVVDYEFAEHMKDFCHFLIDQWHAGKLYTDPTHLFGVRQIKPHPYYRYTKPILLLTNSLDFSAADFFPAIMQDNKRAVILGSRTAGAGGYVLASTFPNHSGIDQFIMTGSLAERVNHKPIENLGVQPDILYHLSVLDLQENYREYVEAIVSTVEKLKKR